MIILKSTSIIGLTVYIEDEEEALTEDSKDHVEYHVEYHTEDKDTKDIEVIGEEVIDKEVITRTRTNERNAIYMIRQAISQISIQLRKDNELTTDSEDKPSIR
jgi:hypothetical protein